MFIQPVFAEEVRQSWTSYAQSINISEHVGKRFIVSAAIKKDSEVSPGVASLWARIDNKGEGTSFFKNDAGLGKVSSDWQVFKISGVIEGNAGNLNFGALCRNIGNYYFDDFKVEIESETGVMQQLFIDNAGFESPQLANKDWHEGIGTRHFDTKNFTISHTKLNPYKGNSSLLIQGSNIPGNEKHGKYVEVNNVKLYYEVYGEGEPLLLLHGNGQSIEAYINQVDEFSKNRQVILLDSRGRGNSTFDENTELTYTIQATDTKLFLDELGLDSVDIVGWSDGGIIGLIMAIKYPEKVKRLVTMGANIFPEGVKQYESFKLNVDKKMQEQNGKYDFGTELQKLLVNYPQLKFEDLAAIKAKTLIMAGDQDEIKNIHTVKMFEAIPNAQLGILPNTTHYMPSRAPEIFNETVLSFFNND